MERKTSFKQVEKYIVTSEVIGRGSFGTVYRGFEKDDRELIVAVKVIPMEKAKSDQLFLKLLKREIEILKKLHNPNIVQLYHVTRTQNNLYLFLEYCRDGDLTTALKARGGRLSEKEAVEYFRQICEGFRELYENNILHRDIKPANILLHENKAKLSDFGFAKVTEEMDKPIMMTMLGTPLYMAPQILAEEKFSSKCDVWSLGMVFFELLYGKTPYTAKSPAQLLKNIRSQPLNFPAEPRRSLRVKNLLKRMLVVEEKDRISWPELFEDDLLMDESESVFRMISEIQTKEVDSLLRSKALNDLYIEKNKVLGVEKGERTLKAFCTETGETSKLSRRKEKATVAAEDYEVVIEEQNRVELQAKTATKVDLFVVFRRNLAVFLNVTTTDFFALFRGKRLPIPEWLFYVCLYSLQQYQVLIFQSIERLMQGKTSCDHFSVKDWKIYLQSEECQASKQVIQADMKYIFPYFQEVKQKLAQFLKGFNLAPLSEKEQAVIRQFQDDSFNALNKPDYQQVIDLVLQHLDLLEQPQEVLSNLRFLQISKTLDAFFTWSPEKDFDFNLFYEEH
jgi:serine/threonine protein kinase